VEELAAARATLANYDEIVGDAQASLESVSNAYSNAGVDFLRLIESQRKLVASREKQVEAHAAYHRRRAELDRIVGGPIQDAAIDGFRPNAAMPHLDASTDSSLHPVN
jgi:outer membrane protein TolC